MSRETETFVHPPHLFGQAPAEPRFWTCVRTKPRWEKKFSRWLTSRNLAHYLPTFVRRQLTGSGDKSTDLPLLPGYVFVSGDRDKGEFKESCSVVYLIRPKPCQVKELDFQITNLHRGLHSGSHLEITHELIPGQPVEVSAGPLRGVCGKFQKWGTSGRLILSIDVLGVGAVLEIPDGSVVVPL